MTETMLQSDVTIWNFNRLLIYKIRIHLLHKDTDGAPLSLALFRQRQMTQMVWAYRYVGCSLLNVSRDLKQNCTLERKCGILM